MCAVCKARDTLHDFWLSQTKDWHHETIVANQKLPRLLHDASLLSFDLTAENRSVCFGLKARRTPQFLIVLYDCCLSDCTNMMTMSHCGISLVINVRLYDSQDALKMDACKKTCLEFYIIKNDGYHEKYMNGGNTTIFKKNSVSSTTHPHENSGTTGVYHNKRQHIWIPWAEDGSARVYGG